jgi:hypothetical protein
MLALHEFGMETAVVGLGTHMYEWSHSPVAVMASLGALSLSVESGLTIGVARSMQSFKRVTEEVKNRYFISQAMTEVPSSTSKIIGTADTAGLAISLGAPGVLARDYLRQPDKPYKERRKVGLKAAAALGTFNGLITGGAIGGASWLAEKLGTDEVSNFVIEAGHSPITYGVLGAYAVSRLTVTSRKNSRLRRQLREQQFDAV